MEPDTPTAAAHPLVRNPQGAVMKNLFRVSFLAFAFLIGAMSPVCAEGRTALSIRTLSEPLLPDLLLYGEDVTKLVKGFQPATIETLKLYQLAQQGDCYPEAHRTCSYQYFLVVSGGYGFPSVVYDIGDVGEISSIVAVEPPASWEDSVLSYLPKRRAALTPWIGGVPVFSARNLARALGFTQQPR